jgi:16S rRNA (cytidine1402-2'-O)-methyltransferase
MLESLLHTLHPMTRLAISSGLTLAGAQIRSDTAQAWKQRPSALDKNTPAVFAIGA